MTEEHSIGYQEGYQSGWNAAIDAKPVQEPDHTAVHLAHCYQGEYAHTCKYGDDDCPARPAYQTALRAALDAQVVEPVVNQQMTTVKESLTDQPRKAVKLTFDDALWQVIADTLGCFITRQQKDLIEAAVWAKLGVEP